MIDYPNRIVDVHVRDKLREIIDEVNANTDHVGANTAAIAKLAPPLTLAQIQKAIQIGGSNPINITGLQGTLANPQTAALTGLFASRPTYASVAIGTIYYATDQSTAYIASSTAWDTIERQVLFGSNYGIWAATLTADRTYTLPDATGNLIYETAALTLNNFLFGGGGALAKDSGFSVVPVANGGTNIASYTVGDLIYASGATTLAKLADAATGNALLAQGTGVAPAYGKVDLTTTVTGVLPVVNGGTGGLTFASIVQTLALTNQGGAISPTTFTGTSGTYRLNYYLEDTTSDVTAGTIQLSVAFTDDAGATTVTSATVALTGAGTLRTSGVFFIRLASGNLTWQTILTGIIGAAKYALFMTLERLS